MRAIRESLEMKLRDYTYQTGDCVTHDTEVAIDREEVRSKVLEFIDAGSGDLPGLGSVKYRFVEHGEDLACLTILTASDHPIMSSVIVPYDKDAADIRAMMDGMVDQYRRIGFPMNCRLPDAIITPCVITFFMPGLLLLLDVDIVRMLGGMPRDFAAAWLDRKFGV